MRVKGAELRELLRRLGPRAAEAYERAPTLNVPAVLAANPGALRTRVPGEPAVTVDPGGSGRWVIKAVGWAPALKNIKAKGVRAWVRARRRDDAVLSRAVGPVPPASGRRLVRFRVAWSKPGRLPDEQNFVEGLADALASVGLLVDDSPRWCRVETPHVTRGSETVTLIEIEDAAVA